MFKKVLGYHRQIAAAGYRVPEGLKGSWGKYKILRDGKEQEIMMEPIGMKIYTCPFGLKWQKKPVLVVHRGPHGTGKWQVDEAVTGQLISSGHDTREAAAAAAMLDIGAAGEKQFWQVQKAVCLAFRKANVPLNQVEILT